MKKNLGYLVLLLATAGIAVHAHAQPKLNAGNIKEVVAAMTLDEKAHLVVGMGMNMGALMGNAKKDSGAAQGPVIGTTQDKVPGAAGTTYAVPRLGIPAIVVADGPAGLRINPIRNDDSTTTYYATAWPIGTLLASSWDTALVKKVGTAFGNEVKEYGVDIILAPALNIHRNPLNGRNFKYYSEDPLIAGSMTSAIVNGIESNGVGTSIKHFAANNQETNRNSVNTIVSERALREIYLKGFEYAVQHAQPWTVMSSYNKINGTYTSESRDLLSAILRAEWDFKGLVMTDWFGGKDPVAQMNAGNDLLMPGTPALSKAIMEGVNSGTLSMQQLDENVSRILNIIVMSPSFNGYNFSNKPDLAQHAAVSRAAAEGMVLLKNKGKALPLTGVKKIATFGITSYDIIAGGTGSGDVNKAYTISMLQGLSNAGYTVDTGIQDVYTAYIGSEKLKHPKKGFIEEFMNPTPPIAEYAANNEAISKAAANTEVAIITIGRNAGEGRDRQLQNDFYLGDTEKTIIQNVADAFHAQNKKVVVVLNIGGVIEMASWRDQVDAILLAWQPGLKAGNAIADVLSGKVNPSGKLATTFPVDYPDVPSAKSFPGKEFPEQASGAGFMRSVPAEVTYDEGVYVGYRYYNTFHVKPAYPFGYGLSYCNFTYSNLKLSSSTFSNSITATLTITNQGKMRGKEVVEIYISAPAKEMDKPAEELKAFAKTKLLKPGETETLSFTLQAADLASFYTGKAAWIADAGKYTVKAGASSDDIRLSADFNVPSDIVVEKVHNLLLPQQPIDEIKGAAANATSYIYELNNFAIGM